MGQGQNVANKLFSELDFEPKFKLKEVLPVEIVGSDEFIGLIYDGEQKRQEIFGQKPRRIEDR